jgi:hypothetical protein
MEALLNKQAQTFAGLVGKAIPSGGTAAAANAGSGGGMGGSLNLLNSFNAGVSGAASAAGKFATGTYTATDALKNFTQISGTIFGPLGSGVAGLVGQIGEGAIAVNESLKKSSQQGAYFGNNLGLYNDAIVKARMTMPEWEETIKQNSKSLAGLGPNMDVSSIGFLKFGQRLQESDYAYKLQATGVQTEEFGKILTLVAHNSRQSDLTQADSRRKMIESAIDIAREFDNTARITGISRQEQQESLDRQLKSKESELAMLAMTDDERKAYEANLASTKKYGDSVQEAIKIYSTGGPMNADETQKIVALGPEMADAARRLSEVKGSTADDEKKREAIKQEMDAIVLRKQSDKAYQEEQVRLYKGGDAQTKAIALSNLEQIRYAQILRRQQEEATRQGKDLATYQKEEQARVEADRKAAAQGKAGSEGEASLPSTTINQVNRFMKDMSVMGSDTVKGLNTSMGNTIKNFDSLNGVLRKWTTDEIVKVPQHVVDKISKAMGVDKPVSAGSEEQKKRAQGYDIGTLGVTGNLFGDFGAGTPAILHGKEAVVTEQQMKNLMSGMQGNLSKVASNMPNPELMIKGLTGNLKADLEKIKASMPITNMEQAAASAAKTVKSEMPQPTANVSQPTKMPEDVMNTMSSGITELNKRIERLIHAVEDGHDKSVRAIKNKGNMVS